MKLNKTPLGSNRSRHVNIRKLNQRLKGVGEFTENPKGEDISSAMEEALNIILDVERDCESQGWEGNNRNLALDDILNRGSRV